MNDQVRGVLLGMAVLFVLVFGGMTLVALASAELNFASIIAFGFSFLIIVFVLLGLIGAIRNPPDEDD
jgi:hypothetical protein